MSELNEKIFKIKTDTGLVIGGIDVDGGGYIIVNGHIIRIPPWTPDFSELYNAISIFESASKINDIELKKNIQESSLNAANIAISQMKERI